MGGKFSNFSEEPLVLFNWFGNFDNAGVAGNCSAFVEQGTQRDKNTRMGACFLIG